MFLIHSFAENRAYIVDANVECTGKEAHEIVKGDEVHFKMKNKRYEGKIINYSANAEFLKKERVKFNKEMEAKESNKDVLVGKKRKIFPKKSWSPTDSLSHEKPKKMARTIKKEKENVHDKSNKELAQNRTNTKKIPKKKILTIDSDSSKSSQSSHISASSENDKKKFYDVQQAHSQEKCITLSPTKQKLKRRLEILEAERAHYDSSAEDSFQHLSKKTSVSTCVEVPHKLNASSSPTTLPPGESTSSSDTVKELSDTLKEFSDSAPENNIFTQLFPADFDGGQMKHIGNNIYCRKVIYDSATGASHKATHMARRLLEGVFTHDCLMNSTLTGQAPRTKGKKNMKVIPLNREAIDALVDYVMAYAAKKNWPAQDRKTILKEMSQKMTEYKNDHHEKDLKD